MILLRINRRITTSLAVLFFCGLLNHSAHAAGPQFTIRDLGTLGGSTSLAYGINRAGQITGYSDLSGNAAIHAFRWDGGTMKDLGSLGGKSSVGYGINSSGQVTGSSDIDTAQHAFIWDGTRMKDLGTLGGRTSYGYGINDAAQVTGFSDVQAGFHAMRWDGAQMLDLGVLNSTQSSGYGINSSGKIAGSYNNGQCSNCGGFYWDGTAVRDIGTLGFSPTITVAAAINDAGQVTGQSSTVDGKDRAFIWSGGTFRDIGVPAGSSGATGRSINNSGQVVGESYYSLSAQHAFFFDGTSMWDLNNQIVNKTGWAELTMATGINDLGQIVGYGTLSTGQRHAFLLTPVPPAGAISITTNLQSASFTVTGPANFFGSGVTATQVNMPAGSYTITYAPVTGFTAPPGETKTLTDGGSLYFSGRYTATATPASRSVLRISGGALASQTLSSRVRAIQVLPSASIAGTIQFGIQSAYPAGTNVVTAVTPSWGTPSSSFLDASAVPPSATEQLRTVNVNWTAPPTPGTYYIIGAFRDANTPAEVMSASTITGGGPFWNDGDDVANWSASLLDQADRQGAVLAPVRTGATSTQQWFAAAIVKVIVGTAPQFSVSPTSLRFQYQAAGTDNVATQTLTIGSSPVGRKFTWSLEPGGDLIVVTPKEPANLTASTTLDISPIMSKPAGLYTGALLISPEGGAVIRVPINVTVTASKVPPVASLVSWRRYLNTNSQPIDPRLPTIVLTHGLQSIDETQATLWTGFGSNQAGGMIPLRTPAAYNTIQYVWEDAFQVTGRGIPIKSEYVAAQSHAESAGKQLSRLLIGALGADYSQPIHFIGHSLGTIVSTYAAESFLRNAVGVKFAQLTMLDRPDHVTRIPGRYSMCAFCTDRENSIRFRQTYGFSSDMPDKVLGTMRTDVYFRLDNYFAVEPTDVGAGVGDIVSGGNGRFYNATPPFYNPNDIGGEYFRDEGAAGVLGIDNDHSGVHQWYRWTIAQNQPAPAKPTLDGWTSVCTDGSFDRPWNFSKTLDPCGKGWAWALNRTGSSWTFPVPNAPASAKSSGSGTPSRAATAAREVPLQFGTITEFGCRVTGATVVTCKEPGSPYAVIPITIPSDATDLSFRYRFASLGDGDLAQVSIDGIPVWTMDAVTPDPGVLDTSSPIPVSGFTPGTHSMIVALHGTGVTNFEFTLQEFNITITPPVTPTYQLLASSASVSKDSGTAQLILTATPSSAPWTAVATSTGNWLSVSTTSGSGSATLDVTFLANPTTTPRTGTILVGGQTFTVTQAGIKPTVDASTPLAGAASANSFVFKFTNPLGFDNLGVVNMLMNDFLNGDKACYIAYSHPAKVLYLVNDNGPGSGLSPGLTLGGTGTVSNGQCTVLAAGSSAVGTGTTLTLTLNIQFKSAFAGSKVIYLAARDVNEVNSGWFTKGVWTIPGASAAFPSPVAIAPATGSATTTMLTYTFDDVTNANNLQTVWALMNTAIDGRQACYAAYYVPGNQLYLYPDNGDGTQAKSIVLTGTNTIQNSQCRINAAGSSVTKSGNRLTLNLNVDLSPTFTGSFAIWTAAQTISLQTSPWKALGAWQVP